MKKWYVFLLFISILLFFHSTVFGLVIPIEQKNPLIERGKSLYKTGNYNEAIEVFSQIISESVKADELYVSYIYLGYSHFTLGEHEKAMVHVENAIEVQPNIKLDTEEFVTEFIQFYDEIKQDFVGIGFFESAPSSAIVYIDKEKVGMTPMKKELLSKKHNLRVVKWWYTPYESEIDITSNRINNIKIDFSKKKNWKGFVRSSVVMIALAILVKSI